ncbi:MAG: hypothetical protein AAF414_12855 [Pseudomonadota bacterium]
MNSRESRFFTPPAVPKVDLHVTSLYGGGECPSQYDGHTTDGREVYVRYRGGRLTIHVVLSAGEEPASSEKILDVIVGPPLDGALSSQQLVSLTGIQVDEPQTTPEVEDESDLSGATKFWRGLGISATKDGMTAFIARVHKSFPQCEIREVFWSESRERQTRKLTADKVATKSALEVVLGPDCPKINLGLPLLEYNFRGYDLPGNDARLSKKVGRAIETIGSRDCVIKIQHVHVSSKFETHDNLARNWLERFDKSVDAAFPATIYLPFDLATGTTVSQEPLILHDDPRIADWLRETPDRFRYVSNGMGFR